MNYPQTIEYLNSFIDYERLSKYPYESFKLKRFKDFCNLIGNPQDSLKVIHVAGSKGKGSTCAFIAYILKGQGFHVGLYTSPHLSDFRERIRILSKESKLDASSLDFEGMISRDEVCKLVKELKYSIDKFNKNLKEPLTFFEVYTALAFKYFKDKKTDFVVLETGLGGRLDATNICSSLLSVITPISLEHTNLLGKRIEEIAFEKVSIIKKENEKSADGRIIALTAKQSSRAMSVINESAKTNNSILIREGREFNYKINKDHSFDYIGLFRGTKRLKIQLLGKHQIANASLAIAASEALRYYNVVIEEAAIRKGLENCFWPARLEILSKKPLIIVDGAHNQASAHILNSAIKGEFPARKIWLVFGIAKDKELVNTCMEISKIGKDIILTKANNPRASEPKDLLKYFKNSRVVVTKNSKEAFGKAKRLAGSRDLILVTGSLYICGEVRDLVLKRK